MRIVFVLWQGGAGGAEAHTARLAAALVARGHWIEVVTLSNPEFVERKLSELGVPHESFPLQRGREILLHARALRRVLESARADVVVLPHNDGLPVLLRLIGYRVPLVAMEHGAALKYRRKPLFGRLRYFTTRAVGSRALAGEIAVSGFAARNLARLPHARMAVICNGVDTREFRPHVLDAGAKQSPASCVFGVAGRLVPGKGVDIAIAAVQEANSRVAGGASVRLKIGGDGPERGRLESLALSLGVADHVGFLGTVIDMPAFWNSVDAAVHVPDTVESFGLALPEAVACGRRAVAARTETAQEVLGDCPAVTFVPPASASAVADQMLLEAARAPASSEERQRYHAWVEDHYGIDITARRYEEVLAAWLSRGPMPRDERSGVGL